MNTPYTDFPSNIMSREHTLNTTPQKSPTRTFIGGIVIGVIFAGLTGYAVIIHMAKTPSTCIPMRNDAQEFNQYGNISADQNIINSYITK